VSMMAIDMKAEGVTVNPLRGITGDAHFNEVFFDDVFVPDTDVVGDVNRGWLVARATLGNERISIGGGSGGQTGFDADDLVKLLDTVPTDVAAQHVRRAGEVIAELHTLRLLNLRRASRAIAGAEPGPEGNVTKLLVAVVGADQKLIRSYLGSRAMTIAGGTSEITRNTIAERILGLPRDPLLK
jgi:alkylation response protein AidB-like acyl-CoA dehydrogenase